MNSPRGPMSPRQDTMHMGKKKFVRACFFEVAKSLWPQTITVTPIVQIVPGD